MKLRAQLRQIKFLIKLIQSSKFAILETVRLVFLFLIIPINILFCQLRLPVNDSVQNFLFAKSNVAIWACKFIFNPRCWYYHLIDPICHKFNTNHNIKFIYQFIKDAFKDANNEAALQAFIFVNLRTTTSFQLENV